MQYAHGSPNATFVYGGMCEEDMGQESNVAFVRVTRDGFWGRGEGEGGALYRRNTWYTHKQQHLTGAALFSEIHALLCARCVLLLVQIMEEGRREKSGGVEKVKVVKSVLGKFNHRSISQCFNLYIVAIMFQLLTSCRVPRMIIIYPSISLCYWFFWGI